MLSIHVKGPLLTQKDVNMKERKRKKYKLYIRCALIVTIIPETNQNINNK